jgi:hypothetical protein
LIAALNVFADPLNKAMQCRKAEIKRTGRSLRKKQRPQPQRSSPFSSGYGDDISSRTPTLSAHVLQSASSRQRLLGDLLGVRERAEPTEIVITRWEQR